MSNVVYPNCITTVLWGNGRIRLRPDQVWEADDPFVKARPELFTTESKRHARSSGHEAAVEQATRAPGEKRTTVRPQKKAAAAKKAAPSATSAETGNSAA